MKLSRDARRQSKELFRLAMRDGRLDADRLRIISDGIATQKPRDYVGMLKHLARLARLEMAKHHAVIESAIPLPPDSQQSIQESLSKRFGLLTTEFRHTPSLIGGLRIRLGSNVWDGSVQSRLESLKQP